MRKKIFMFLLALLFIVPSAFLVACGNNDNNGGQSVTVERVEVTPKSGTHFTYEYGCFYLEAGYNPVTEITKDAFTVVLYYSDGSKVEDFKDYTLSVMANENGNYTAKVKYENYYLSDYTVIVNDEILDAFVGITQEQDEYDNEYYLYTNDEIVYKGSAYNILNEIKTTNNVSISTLIQQGKVYLNSETPGDTTATDANQQNDDYIYYYNFFLYASNGYVWQIDGQTISVMSIKWRILPQEIAITAPTMTTEGALEYNGTNQVPAFSFDAGTAEYFDMQAEYNQHKDVGEYTYVINLKNEYSTSNNYHFTVNDSTNVHQNTEYVGYVQLEASWSISPKQLAINASDIAITNNDGTKQYEGEETVYPRFVYNPDGIDIETTVDDLTDVFNVEGHVTDITGDCIYYYGVTLQEGAAGNYVYANGDTVTEGVGLPYYVADAEGSLPVGMPANIILNKTTFNNSSLYNYSFSTDMIDTSDGKTVISQEVLDALDAATSLNWKNEYYVLQAGENEVVVLYKVLNYTAVEFTVTWPVEKAEMEIEEWAWRKANDGNLVYRPVGYQEAYIYLNTWGVNITYVTQYKEFGAAEYAAATPVSIEDDVKYFADAGQYRTTATLTAGENYYITYDGFDNDEKQSIITLTYDWEIERAAAPGESWRLAYANYTNLQRYEDETGEFHAAYYVGSEINIDYDDEAQNIIANDTNIISIEGNKYIVTYQYYSTANHAWEEVDEKAENPFERLGLYRVMFTFNLNKNYYIDAETINVVYMEFEVYSTSYIIDSVPQFNNAGTYVYTGDRRTSTPRIDRINGLYITYTYYYSNDQEIDDIINYKFMAGTYKVSAKITAIPGLTDKGNVRINTTETELNIDKVTFTITKQQLNKSSFNICYPTENIYNNNTDYYMTVVEGVSKDLVYIFDKTVVLTLNNEVVAPGTVLEPNTTYQLTLTVKLSTYYQDAYELVGTNADGEWTWTTTWTTGKHQINTGYLEFDATSYNAFPTIDNIQIKSGAETSAFPASVTNWKELVNVTFVYMTYDPSTGDTDILDVNTQLESGKRYKVEAWFSVKDAYAENYEVIDYLRDLQLEWDQE